MLCLIQSKIFFKLELRLVQAMYIDGRLWGGRGLDLGGHPIHLHGLVQAALGPGGCLEAGKDGGEGRRGEHEEDGCRAKDAQEDVVGLSAEGDVVVEEARQVGCLGGRGRSRSQWGRSGGRERLG